MAWQLRSWSRLHWRAYAVPLRESMPEDSSSGSAAGAGIAVTVERPAQEREGDAMENRTERFQSRRADRGLRGRGVNSKIRYTVLYDDLMHA